MHDPYKVGADGAMVVRPTPLDADMSTALSPVNASAFETWYIQHDRKGYKKAVSIWAGKHAYWSPTYSRVVLMPPAPRYFAGLFETRVHLDDPPHGAHATCACAVLTLTRVRPPSFTIVSNASFPMHPPLPVTASRLAGVEVHDGH